MRCILYKRLPCFNIILSQKRILRIDSLITYTFSFSQSYLSNLFSYPNSSQSLLSVVGAIYSQWIETYEIQRFVTTCVSVSGDTECWAWSTAWVSSPLPWRRLQSDGWVLATETTGPLDHQRMQSSADGHSISNVVVQLLRLVHHPTVGRQRPVKLFRTDG